MSARSTPRKTANARPKRTAGPSQAPAPQLIELGQAFRRLFRTLNRLRGRDTHLGGQELSHAQFELLIELDERGELSAGDLAAAATLTPATVTQMLDHLAACGHVERTRSETDRRVVVSRLTVGGSRRIRARREEWTGRWEQALSDVPPEDLRAATRVLERLGAMFEDGPAGNGCGAAKSSPGAPPPAPLD
jgi:MarR family transcriptional regulator, organic hydroperoxide resistance regulator